MLATLRPADIVAALSSVVKDLALDGGALGRMRGGGVYGTKSKTSVVWSSVGKGTDLALQFQPPVVSQPIWPRSESSNTYSTTETQNAGGIFFIPSSLPLSHFALVQCVLGFQML